MMVIKGSRQGFVSEISHIDSTEVTEYQLCQRKSDG